MYNHCLFCQYWAVGEKVSTNMRMYKETGQELLFLYLETCLVLEPSTLYMCSLQYSGCLELLFEYHKS